VREDQPEATLTVTRSGELAAGVTVDYATNDGLGTALAGEDYVSTSGTLTFADGEASKTISVPLIDDALEDDGETFHVELTGVGGTDVELGVPTSTAVTIDDDDTVDAWIQFDAASFAAGEGSAAATIRVVRTGNLSRIVTVDYATDPGGSATAGSDYTATSGTLSFDAGEAAKTFMVDLLDDCQSEDAETVALLLSNPGGAAGLGTLAAATLTIRDDDVPGVVQLERRMLLVGEGAGAATVTVVRRGGRACDVSVDYATSDGTAMAGTDYEATSGTLSFGQGETRLTFDVPITQDDLGEANETAYVALSNPTGGARLGSLRTTVLKIVEDERVLAFAQAVTVVPEMGRQARIRVRRSGNMQGSATVSYETAPGSAEAEVDYASVSGTLTFGPGVALRTFSVPILRDALDEPDETILLRLHDPVEGALGAQATALLTIRDDDAGGLVRFAAPRVRVAEGERTLSIQILRTRGLADDVTVDYAASGGSASAGLDYDALGGTLTFGPGQRAAAFDLVLHGDAEPEGQETVEISLSNPTGGAEIGSPSTATVVIVDDEPVVELASALYVVPEGRQVVLSAVRSGDLSAPATVDYATSDGSASAPDDYRAVAGTLSFPPGAARRVIGVATVPDRTDEGDEMLTVTLDNPVGATLGAQSAATVTVRDNDTGGELRFLRPTFSVGEAAGVLRVVVQRRAGTAAEVTVECRITGGSATPGADYEAPATDPVVLSFRPGQRTQTLTLPILDDSEGEGSETIELALANPTGGATLGSPATAVVAIGDDDAPTFSFTAAAFRVAEGAPRVRVSVRRMGSGLDSATVDFAAGPGTASSGVDFEAQSGTLTFGPGVARQTFVVPIANDTLDEGPETIELTLTNPSPGTFLALPQRALLTILDDDRAGRIELASPAISAGEGDGLATIKVFRRNGAAGDATVQFAVTAGSASAGTDFAPVSGTLTFPPGEHVQTIDVSLVAGAVSEPAESVVVSLSDPGGGAVLGGLTTATLWIVDDD